MFKIDKLNDVFFMTRNEKDALLNVESIKFRLSQISSIVTPNF